MSILFDSKNAKISLNKILSEFIKTYIDCYVVFSEEKVWEAYNYMYPPENSNIIFIPVKPVVHISLQTSQGRRYGMIVSQSEKGQIETFYGSIFIIIDDGYVNQQDIKDKQFVLDNILDTLNFVFKSQKGMLKAKGIKDIKTFINSGIDKLSKNNMTFHVADMSCIIETQLRWNA